VCVSGKEEVMETRKYDVALIITLLLGNKYYLGATGIRLKEKVGS